MLHPGRIQERSGDHAGVVDVDGAGGSGAGKIDLSECAILKKPAMLTARRVKKETDDLSLGINEIRFGRNTSRRVKLGEGEERPLRAGRNSGEYQGQKEDREQSPACFHGRAPFREIGMLADGARQKVK